MNEIEKNESLNDEKKTDNGLTFHWFNLIIGFVISYFLFDEFYTSWTLPFSLVLAIAIHELGHLIIGKSFGCVVKEMQVFFLCFVSYRPKQVSESNSWRNIKWSLGSLPLGGFTLFKMRSDDAEEALPCKESAKASPYIDDKPAWQQLLISAGGMLFNFAAIFIFFLLSELDIPYQWSILCVYTGGLSLMLILLNIIPIYPLDCGRIIFSFFEMVTGKKLPTWWEDLCGIIGFILIIIFFYIYTDWFQLYLEHIADFFDF